MSVVGLQSILDHMQASLQVLLKPSLLLHSLSSLPIDLRSLLTTEAPSLLTLLPSELEIASEPISIHTSVVRSMLVHIVPTTRSLV